MKAQEQYIFQKVSSYLQNSMALLQNSKGLMEPLYLISISHKYGVHVKSCNTIGHAACMEVSTCCRVFSCSEHHVKLVASWKTESGQHAQTLNVFLPKSKDVHQALCHFFRYRDVKLKTMFFPYNISEVWWSWFTSLMNYLAHKKKCFSL